MSALSASLGSSCGHDRLTFGCAGCARRRDEALLAAELAAAPVRKVTMAWELRHRGVIELDEQIPTSWDQDRVRQRVNELFDSQIADALADADVEILMSVEMTDYEIDDPTPAAPQPDPAQTALDFGAAS